MELDTALAGLELVERVAGDVAHTVPAVKTILDFGLKGANKETITTIMNAGMLELATVGDKLLVEEVRVALTRVDLLEDFTDKYSGLSLVFCKLEKEVARVKFYDLLGKRSLYNRSRNARKDASALKVDVWTTSTWARLGFNLRDGELVADTLEIGTGHRHPLNSPSEETLATVVVRDDGPHNQDSSFPYSGGAAPSSTDSIFGNPFLGYNPIDTTPLDNDVVASSNRVIKIVREALSLLKLDDKSARRGA